MLLFSRKAEEEEEEEENNTILPKTDKNKIFEYDNNTLCEDSKTFFQSVFEIFKTDIFEEKVCFNVEVKNDKENGTIINFSTSKKNISLLVDLVKQLMRLIGFPMWVYRDHSECDFIGYDSYGEVSYSICLPHYQNQYDENQKKEIDATQNKLLGYVKEHGLNSIDELIKKFNVDENSFYNLQERKIDFNKIVADLNNIQSKASTLLKISIEPWPNFQLEFGIDSPAENHTVKISDFNEGPKSSKIFKK